MLEVSRRLNPECEHHQGDMRSGAQTRVLHDRHVEGLFSASTWLDTFRAVGFDARPRPYRHTEVERPIDVFLARRADK